jgi:hypothetical protein
MNKLLTLTAAAAALAIGAPAAAQTWQPGWQANTNARGAMSFDSRIAQLEARLDAGIRAGTIGRNEAQRLRWELAELRRLERHYSRGGIDQRQHAELQQRLIQVRQQIRTADRGSWDRYERPGDWAEYDDPYRGQYGYGYGQGADFAERIAQLEQRLEAGIRSRMIDRREAARLRSELFELRRIERQYSQRRMGPQQHAELRQRIASLRQQIRVADRGSYDRYERRGEWAEYDAPYRRDPYSRDPYGRDPYGRTGRGGPYEDPCATGAQGGIGGVIGSIFGVGGSACLRVGDRAHANLGAVPWEYRDRFRDGGGLYYRSDGRAIYAIDARTHTVVEVHPIYQ